MFACLGLSVKILKALSFFVMILQAGGVQAAPSQLPWDTVATRFLDDQLSQGIDIVNMDLEEDYRQVNVWSHITSLRLVKLCPLHASLCLNSS